MEKNKLFLYLIKDKNTFYNKMMHDVVELYVQSSEYYDGYMEYFYNDETNDYCDILTTARDKGIDKIMLDTNIEKAQLYNILAQSKRYGFIVEDITSGVDISNHLLEEKVLSRKHTVIETKSEKALGILWNDDSLKLKEWYKQFCDKNEFEYSDTIQISTDNRGEIMKSIEYIKSSGIGKILVAGPYFMVGKENESPLVEYFKEEKIETIDALFNRSLTDCFCFDNRKKGIAIFVGDDNNPLKEVAEYAKERDYEITFGCSLTGDLHPVALLDIIPQLAFKEEASVILIYNKEQFPFNKKEWNNLIEILENNDISIDSTREGTLEQEDTQSLRMMH